MKNVTKPAKKLPRIGDPYQHQRLVSEYHLNLNEESSILDYFSKREVDQNFNECYLYLTDLETDEFDKI